MKKIYPVFLLLLLFSCKKDLFIANNVAPPDQTVEDVTINNYISRTYITVLGHQPDSLHRATGFALLRNSNLSMASRMQFLDTVFNDAAYFPHLYDLARIDLLKSLDTNDINSQIIIFNTLLSNPFYKDFAEIFKYEIVRLDTLKRIPADLKNHQLDITHLHIRCVNNYFYDQINMGTENFVVSCFQHFLNRYPTVSELDQSKIMVDGVIPATVFLQSGQGKLAFINIFFNSAEYSEGLVINLYHRLLLREPTSVEMNLATQKFTQVHNYEQLQKDILSTNEFIGIK